MPKPASRRTPAALAAPLLALALAMSACAAPGTEPPTAAAAGPAMVTPEMVRLAEMAFEDGLFEEARQRYLRLVAMQPGEPRHRLGLAETALAVGDDAQARTLFDEVLASGKPEVLGRAHQGKGLSLLRGSRPRLALEPLKAAVAADPGLWRAWNGLGLLHDADGAWDLADEAYGKALLASHGAAEVLNNHGYSRLLRGQPTQAAALFIKALRARPGMPRAEANLRLALAAQGQYREAQAGARPTALPDVLNNVGYVAMVRGDHGKAEAYLSQALEASPAYFSTASENLLRLRALKTGG